MSLAIIYESIRDELLQVEENLKQVAQSDLPGLSMLLNHVLQRGGKRIRPALTLLSGRFYRYHPPLLISMATAVELLHTATLVHDDTVDNSSLRRGSPTVNSLWGNSTAVLVGDYLFAASARLATTAGNLRAMQVFSQAIMVMSSGEIAETFSAFDLKRTRQHYYHQIGSKTAALFSAATEVGAILSEAPEEAIQALASYGYNLGMSFQIVDDILDFIGEEEVLGKPAGSDLLQGNITLPAILFLEHHPQGDSLREALESRGRQERLKPIIQEIRQSSIIDECYNVAASFCSQACVALEVLPENEARQALIKLADYVLTRKK